MLASTTSANLRRWVSRQATAPLTRRGMASTVAKMAAPQQSSTAVARGFALAAGAAVAGYTMLPREETVRDTSRKTLDSLRFLTEYHMVSPHTKYLSFLSPQQSTLNWT